MSLTRYAALLAGAVVACAAATASAQYTRAAGQNAPTVSVEEKSVDALGKVHVRTVQHAPPRDSHGNANGNQFDLAVDGAFEGQTVAVLHFYTGEGFDFSLPRGALAEKGFSVYRWINTAPSPEELARGLEKANQLWIISGDRRQLNEKHLAVIKKFFDAGHGVYIWGDNEPFYADANYVAEALLGTKMLGNVPGGVVVGVQPKTAKPGVKRGHLVTTGLEHLFEGITIATIQPNQTLEPLVYGSAGNLVTSVYDRGGKRAILDGGFTRLYLSWDQAGTARYVKNAAAWLANAERFGSAVVSRAAAR